MAKIRFFNKIFLAVFLIVGNFILAQTVPPPPENPESGDIGAPASPIDSYTLGLFILGIIIIFALFARKKLIIR